VRAGSRTPGLCVKKCKGAIGKLKNEEPCGNVGGSHIIPDETRDLPWKAITVKKKVCGLSESYESQSEA
jgi:hypothetical protein